MSEDKKPLVKNVVLGNHQPFSLSITTGRLILAKKKDLDIADPDNGIMGRMFVDPIALAENVFRIFGDRICKAGIDTEEEFYELLDDEGNKALDIAFKNSVRDFFTWGETYVKHVDGLINSTEERVEEVLEKMTEQSSPSQEESGTPSGSTQESSE